MPKTETTDNRPWRVVMRERISQILVKNNLRTDQVAILELLSLMEDVLAEGEMLAYAKRQI